MVTKQKALKLIKEKVDGRTSRHIKLKKPVAAELLEGIGYKRKVRRRIVKLVKDGNSVNFVDDTYFQQNINILDTKELHQILWQVITENEKKEIALEHLLLTKQYLNNI